jgi:EAL domain-containing protein (putative c-di-GMP-specific phosphodiesterase class I)
VVRYADAALYEAKARGRGRFVLFEAALLAEQSRQVQQIARARAALAWGHITPYYQPKVDLADGTVVGLEALLRIVEPGRAAGMPSDILAAFDEAEIAQALGSRLLDRVLDDISGWIAGGVPFGRVAINVSATELGDPTFARRFITTLEERNIPPQVLEIEILETVLLDQRSAAVLASVRELSDAGVRIAFDDFGTGYAALAHLPGFPVNTIKIDQSFVLNLTCPANQAIVRALVGLALELGLEAVAEGVETTRQAVDLLTLGCTVGQGFLYSEAVPAHEIESLLRRHSLEKRRPRVIMVTDRMRVPPQAA